jgi:hypothetical protein
MKLQNIDKVQESINKFQEDESKHYFVIDRPTWDNQNLYYEIYYNVEAELFHGGYIEVCSLVPEDELDQYIEHIKTQFNLPVKKWERVLVEFYR